MLLLLRLRLQVHVLQQEAALSELLASQKSSSSTWTEERQQLEESTSKWRQKAVQLQQEVSCAMGDGSSMSKHCTQSRQAVDTSGQGLLWMIWQLPMSVALTELAKKAGEL